MCKSQIALDSPVNPVQKDGQPGRNCNKSKVLFFLQLYIGNLTKKKSREKKTKKEQKKSTESVIGGLLKGT